MRPSGPTASRVSRLEFFRSHPERARVEQSEINATRRTLGFAASPQAVMLGRFNGESLP